MRVLLDENLPRRLAQDFKPGVDVMTVVQRGWGGLKNGELIRLAENEFDAFVTMDQGIEYQQNIGGLAIAVIILRAASNRYDDLQPLMPEVNKVLDGSVSGKIVHVGQ